MNDPRQEALRWAAKVGFQTNGHDILVYKEGMPSPQIITMEVVHLIAYVKEVCARQHDVELYGEGVNG